MKWNNAMTPRPFLQSQCRIPVMGILLVLFLVCCTSGAGAATPSRGLPPPATTTPAPTPVQLVMATPTPTMITCPAPCACMERSAAVAQWGTNGFSQCAEQACGYATGATRAPVAKYCFRQTVVTQPAAPYYPPPVTTTPTPTYYQLVTIPITTAATQEPKKLVTLSIPYSPNIDADLDGLPDTNDNCPYSYNPGQQDADREFLGCPPGSVAKMPDPNDLAICAELVIESARKTCEYNAFVKANPGFTGGGCNFKRDGKGDACDNCRNIQNTGQADSDGDCESLKNDPAFWDGTQWQKDPLCGDACDICPYADNTQDSDHDGVPDGCDNCRTMANPDRIDTDKDCVLLQQDPAFWDSVKKVWIQDPHCGNACDTCPSDVNPEQLDTNKDGTGDACSCSWCTDARIRPVYISGETGSSIDIIFVPSATGYDMKQTKIVQRDDYNKSEPVFRGIVLDNIRNGFFKLDSYSSKPVPADFRERFNFYYYWDPSSPADAHNQCGGTLPSGFGTAVPFRDAAIILYPAVATSVGTAAGGCSNSLGSPAQISAPGFWQPTLLHESGHGVFGLVDTYCSRPQIDTYYGQNDPYSNVWISESNCKQSPTGPYWPLNATTCRRIDADDPATPKNPDCSIDFWRSDPDPDVMRDTDFSSRFGTAGVRRITYVFDSYPSP